MKSSMSRSGMSPGDKEMFKAGLLTPAEPSRDLQTSRRQRALYMSLRVREHSEM